MKTTLFFNSLRTIREKPSRHLFLLSFLILFFELICIRWMSSYVLYLGFFRNFVLLGALLGIGVGSLLARRPLQLFRWVPLLILLLFTLLLLVRVQVAPENETFIFFTSLTETVRLSLPAEALLPLIFFGVTVLFACLSQDLGRLLTRLPPLKAYNTNILGSLTGIAGFTVLSFLSAPAWTWFLVAALLLILMLPQDGGRRANIALSLLFVLVIFAGDYYGGNFWSPYNRLNIIEVDETRAYDLIRPGQPKREGEKFGVFANGIAHQLMTPNRNVQEVYGTLYGVIPATLKLEEVLVVGAGGGNDVSFALANGADHVDAVDIDPQIVEFGRSYHPEQPYQDSRVEVFVDDGRAFLENSNKRYDLIIFALPDSLTLATNVSNLRLESYLFTVEAFESVREHLEPDGVFVLYNFFRADWIVSKLGAMLEEVFGAAPLFHRQEETLLGQLPYTTLFAGPDFSQLDLSGGGFFEVQSGDYQNASDDWPYLYLQNPSLPSFYSLALGIILVFSFVLVRIASPAGAIQKHGLPFFFMGAAFTLLEVKSIVNFLLLFGATWIVNSLVFFGILLIVLVANALAARYAFKRMEIWYGLLLLSLVINYFVPLDLFLGTGQIVRFAAATVFLFSPIFFANLIYSASFRDTQQADISYGANLLGTMLGGATEYLSLALGYQSLVILAGIFYLAAFYFFGRWRRERLS